ncbi:MAG: hypothetical protein ISP91_04630 [Pseudomonadales bacterium]|nr:hypothetical protein [Pseudomonadales bacterium]
MAHTIQEKGNIFQVTFSGVLDITAMEACFMDLLAAMENNPAARFLISYAEIDDYQLSAEEVRGISEAIKSNSDGPSTFKMAFVIPSDLEFGMGRMFLSNVDENSSYAMSRDEPAAMTWLTR